MTTCWYCDERSADPEAAYEFEMHQHVPPYHSTTVSVPRCGECAAIHGRINRVAKRGALVFFVAPTFLCLLLLVLRSVLAWGLHWGIPVAIAVVTGALIMGIESVWERRVLEARGTDFERRALGGYPEAKELKTEGWKHYPKSGRPSVPATRTRPTPDRMVCAGCGTRWSGAGLGMAGSDQRHVFGAVQPGSTQYAGRCPECRKAYCARCARTRDAGLGVMISQCPDCGVDLLASLSD